MSVVCGARSARARMTAAAPSVVGQQSKSPRGSATFGARRYCSGVISFWKCAFGFSEPREGVLTATAPSAPPPAPPSPS